MFPLKDLNILKIKEEDLATPRVITGRYNLFPRTSGGKYTLFKNNFDRINIIYRSNKAQCIIVQKIIDILRAHSKGKYHFPLI